MAITPPNFAPNTNPVSVSGPEDIPVSVPFTGVDLDGFVAAFQVVLTLPQHGHLTDLNGNPLGIGSVVPASANSATILYVPDPDWSGVDTFKYAARDNLDLQDATPATATITITPVNDPPQTFDTSASGVEDAAQIALVLKGSDVDGTVQSFTITKLPTDGTLKDGNGNTLSVGSVVAATGNQATILFVPNANWNGQNTFEFASKDNSGLDDASPAIGTITVTPVNDPPDAVNDFGTTAEDTPISFPAGQLLANDTDPDNDALIITSVQDAVNGTVNFVAGVATFTPDANYSGPASFTYTIDDGHGGTDTAKVNINVTPVNDPPDAVNDLGTTAEDTPIAFSAATLLANDTDPENDALIITSVQDAVNGTVNFVAGVATFTPDANYSGPASFTYTIDDGHGGTDTAKVNINVTPVNDPPETQPTASSGAEDTPIAVSLLGSDPDGVVATFVIQTLPANGVLSYNGSPVSVGQEIPASGGGATLSFLPNANWNGETEFDYASKDNEGLIDLTPATVTITVDPVADPPETEKTSASGVEDATLIPVTLSGSDEDGTVVKFTIKTLPTNGTLTDADGNPYAAGATVGAAGGSATVYFTPNANWNGTTNFEYASQDNEALNDPTPAVATIVITPVNDGPDAIDDAGTTPEDVPIAFTTGQLLGNDTDPENDTLTVTSVQDPVNGTVSLVGGVATFTPDANYSGPASFTYSISDGNGGTDTATVNINVIPVNDPPDAVNDAGSTPEDTPVTFGVADLLGNDTDPENDTLTVTSVQNPVNGTVSLVGGVVTFTPAANYSGPASFTYSISDGHGGVDTATVNVDVIPVNDPPDTLNTTANGAEDAAAIPVSLQGTDVDGTVATFTINSLPANGTLIYNGQPVLVGQVIPAVGNGAGLSFTPNANWNGTTDFNYTATDNLGSQDPTPGLVTINVAGVNDAPETNNSSAQGIKGALNIGLNLTGSDPDGTVTSFTIKSLPANGTLKDGNGNTLSVGSVVSATGNAAEVFFTPSATFTGTVNFNYASNDNDGAQDATPATGTVVITPPIAAPDPKPPETFNTSASGNEDVVKLAVNLTGSDTDGTVKFFVINNLPANGKLYDGNGNQLAVGSQVPATGNAATVYFTPNANWNGDTSFNYASKDNDNLVDATPAKATIHINAVNDGPDTCDVSVCADSCADYVKVGLSGSDIDGKVTGFVITTLPTDGVLKSGSTVLKVGDVVAANAYGQASVTFYPNSHWDGVSTFKYASKDNGGAVDATPATATIKVAHANDGPETIGVTATGVEDGPPVILKITGTDSDGTVTAFKIDSLPTGGVLKFGTQVLKAGDVISATANGATLTFTPNADWSGSTTFQYRARDNDGAYDSSPATGKVTITGDNDGPSTKDVTACGTEDCGPIAVCLQGTDPDGTVVSFTVTDLPANGVLKTAGGTVVTAGMVIPASGNGATLYFTPNANWNGSTSFHYAAKDNSDVADATPNTAAITVTGVNDAPTTSNAAATGTEDQTTGVKVTLAGADIDGTVTAFKITSIPINGVLKDGSGNTLAVGSLVTASAGQAFVYFTPKANFSGDATFQFAAKDNGGLYDGSPATATVKITGVNDGPDAIDDTASVTAGQVLKLASTTLLSNDKDADGDTLSITSVQSASHGTVSLGADGAVSFTATAGYTGAASYSYTVSDGHGGTDTATVSIDVKAPSAPSAPAGTGAHSAGWWCGTGAVYWDGETDGSGVKHGPTYGTLPKAELTYKVDTNGDCTTDSNKFLLIGDFNKNGVADNGEHTYLMSLSDAKALLGTSSSDAREVLGKELVATWLNYLSENPVGTTGNASSPAWFVREAVDWLSQVSGTVKTLPNGTETVGGLSGGDFNGADVSQSGAFWNTGINLDGVSGIQSSGKDVLAGDDIQDALLSFNTTGMIGSTIWASNAD